MDETSNHDPEKPAVTLLRFEWDPAKADANLKKHGVSFNEAATAFDDPYAVFQTDELHSDEEVREWAIAYSNLNRLLLITFIEREPKLIRIITARKPTRQERTIYEKAT